MIKQDVVRPAMLAGVTWPVKEVQEKKLDVAEKKMLIWMCEVTNMDKIRNKRIRGTTKIVDLFEEGTGKKAAKVRPCGEKREDIVREKSCRDGSKED